MANAPALIRVKAEPNWAEFRKRVTVTDDLKAIDSETGEYLDCVEVVPRCEEFVVDIKKRG
jgi:hypothetical protein